MSSSICFAVFFLADFATAASKILKTSESYKKRIEEAGEYGGRGKPHPHRKTPHRSEGKPGQSPEVPPEEHQKPSSRTDRNCGKKLQ
ncbi:MAG: hypothetical protein DSO00_05290 [Archaeoglobi archaeon]|nr:MAG: hypothetical protein DSO00_05290 [Archaeoglobi archaeon]